MGGMGAGLGQSQGGGWPWSGSWAHRLAGGKKLPHLSGLSVTADRSQPWPGCSRQRCAQVMGTAGLPLRASPPGGEGGCRPSRVSKAPGCQTL